MSSVRDFDIKNRTYYFLNHNINIENLDPNNIKIDGKPNKNIVIYLTGYVTRNSVNTMYLIINKINEYLHGHNEDSKGRLKSMRNYGQKLNHRARLVF